MALAPVYAPQGPADLTPAPQRDPSAFGGDIAPALDQVGQAVKQVQTAHQATAYAVDDANRGVQMSQAYRDAQASANPDGSGFADQVNQQFDKIYGNVQLPTDPELRSRAQIQMAQDRARYLDQAQGHAATLLGTSLATNGQNAIDLQANDLSQNAPTDPAGAVAALNAAHGKLDSMVAGLAGLHPEAAVKLRQEGEQSLGTSLVNGLVDRGQVGTARTLLNAGTFNATLKPEQLQALDLRIDAEQRRQDAQAREAVSQAKAQVGTQVELLKTKVAQGVTPDPAAIAATASAAAKYGLGKDVFDLGTIQAKIAVNTETMSWQPVQFDTEINRLSALDAEKKATPAEQMRLHQLQDIAPQRKAAFTSNPGGFAASNGTPPPAIDPTTSDGFQQRAQWRQGVQAATKVPFVPTLSADEAKPFIDQVEHGTADDRMQVAQMVQHWGSEAPNVLRQISPNTDSAFAQAVRLGATNPANMRDAILGAQVDRKLPMFQADPNDAYTLMDQTTGKPIPAEGIVSQVIGKSLMNASPTYFASVQNNAMNIYGATALRNGWSKLHGGGLQEAVNRAVGGTQGPGGVWTGGMGRSNGEQIVLPPTATQAAFDRRTSRATVADFTRAGGGATPSFANRPMTQAEIGAAVKVYMGGSRYGLRIGNTFARAGGKIYSFSFDQLPQR